MRWLLLLGLIQIAFSQNPSIVQTIYGPVQGNVNAQAREFLAIPFAMPPVGQLRWTYPVAPNPWTQPLNCTVFGPGCAQDCDLPPLTCPDVISEDCLQLNVFTPLNIQQPLPVMFFVPGGRFEQGAAGTWIYWGDLLANKSNVIVVTTNYRLGALGFLGSQVIPGNYGIEDQRFALQWVQQNIAAFGGDPTQVTLFGQSAGGTSTSVHLTSQASYGLFAKAIIHSNPFTLPLHDPISAGEVSRDFALFLGCVPNDLACMRNKTTDQIIAASDKANDHLNFSDPISMFYPWAPMIDGIRVDAQPLWAFAAGNFTKVPIMVGNVEEEALLFIWEVFTNPMTELDYVSAVELVFGPENSKPILEMYPPPPYNNTDYRYVANQLGTDWIFTCPNRYIAAGINQYGDGLPLYVYRFNHALSFDGWGPNYTECVGHVCHGSELVYLFQSEATDNSGFNFTNQEQWMADWFTAAWGNFAHTNNPNTPGKGIGFDNSKLPGNAYLTGSFVGDNWPLWNPNQDIRITIETPTSNQVLNWRSSYCDFWDTYNYLEPKAPPTN